MFVICQTIKLVRKYRNFHINVDGAVYHLRVSVLSCTRQCWCSVVSRSCLLCHLVAKRQYFNTTYLKGGITYQFRGYCSPVKNEKPQTFTIDLNTDIKLLSSQVSKHDFSSRIT